MGEIENEWSNATSYRFWSQCEREFRTSLKRSRKKAMTSLSSILNCHFFYNCIGWLCVPFPNHVHDCKSKFLSSAFSGKIKFYLNKLLSFSFTKIVLLEKNVLVIEKKNCKTEDENLQQWKVRTNFVTECFFNLFLEASQIHIINQSNYNLKILFGI